jgi:hypothetical protein
MGNVKTKKDLYKWDACANQSLYFMLSVGFLFNFLLTPFRFGSVCPFFYYYFS